MKFCWSTLMVKNMEESLKFYQEIVGLNVKRRFPAGPGTELAFLGEGDTDIELICNQNRKEIDAGKDISWGFETKSLEQTIAVLKEKGYEFSGPYQPNPSLKFIYVLDPNGMKIQFIENL